MNFFAECPECHMCIGKEPDAHKRRGRWRKFFASLVEEKWMDEGHVLFFSGLRVLAGRLTLDGPLMGERETLKEWCECGLLEMLLAVLKKVAGTWQEGGLQWQRLRLLFIARSKEEGSVFSLLDEPIFQKIVSFVSARSHDRSYLDQSWIAEDQNAFCPFYILKALGSMAQDDMMKEKLWALDWLGPTRPFLFGAMTTLETCEAARFVANMASLAPTIVEKMNLIWAEDWRLLRRMEYLCFHGEEIVYRDIWRGFGFHGKQPYYFHDALNSSGDFEKELKALSSQAQQVQESGVHFFSDWLQPSMVPILLKETRFFRGILETKHVVRQSTEVFNSCIVIVFEEVCRAGSLRVALDSSGLSEKFLLDCAESLHQDQFVYAALLLAFLLDLPHNDPRADLLYVRCLPFLECGSEAFHESVGRLCGMTALEVLCTYEKRTGRFHAAQDWRLRLVHERKMLSPSLSCGKCAKEGGKLLLCSRCKSVRYCNADCQRAHYAMHKQNCRPAQYSYFFRGNWNDSQALDEALIACPLEHRSVRSKLLLARFRSEIQPLRDVGLALKLFVSARMCLGDEQMGDDDARLAFDAGLFAGRRYAVFQLHMHINASNFIPLLRSIGCSVWTDECIKKYGPFLTGSDDDDIGYPDHEEMYARALRHTPYAGLRDKDLFKKQSDAFVPRGGTGEE